MIQPHKNYITDLAQSLIMSKLSQFFNNVSQAISGGTEPINLAADKKQEQKRVLDWQNKALSLVRKDVKEWKNAWQNTTAEDDPKNFPLQLIYENDVMIDALLTSQLENRINKMLKTEYSIKAKKSKERDDEQTDKMTNSIGVRTVLTEIAKSYFLGYSLLEISVIQLEGGEQELKVYSIPRTNVVPQKGRFYPDVTADKYINYRELTEFGTYILEFDTEGVGLLNKVVPHVLFKRFALSCWSELCEIFGIPPRTIKTDTQNPKMLARAEKMMMDTGAAAWFIIDESEKMEWGEGVATNGDVFKSLINAENNEISMLISGAIIGQDTVNGNRSKDESAREVLEELVASDLKRIEMLMNATVIPALIKIGFLKSDVVFEFDATEDLDTLWTRTKDTFTDFEVDPEFIRTKFGVQILGAKKKNEDTGKKLTWENPFV